MHDIGKATPTFDCQVDQLAKVAHAQGVGDALGVGRRSGPQDHAAWDRRAGVAGGVLLRLIELLLAHPRQRRPLLRTQRSRTALSPRVTLPLHRADADPQIPGDRQTNLTPGRTARMPGAVTPRACIVVRRSARHPVDSAGRRQQPAL
ncbi:hypothetical protein [Streptomyces sp. NPDC056661]|uniref:hypothetical protein n=1 Tax=Streptomyces sp. NPDC056661 TaxID=3345898 RepID=UPI0036929EE9